MLDVIKKAREMGMDVSICDASARHPSAPEKYGCCHRAQSPLRMPCDV